LLKDLDLPGRVAEAAPEESRLVLQELDLRLEVVDLLLVPLQLFLGIGRCLLRHRGSYLPSSRRGSSIPIYDGAPPIPWRGILSYTRFVGPGDSRLKARRTTFAPP